MVIAEETQLGELVVRFKAEQRDWLLDELRARRTGA